MRLIDADALIQDIREHSASYFADDFAHEWVDKQPTIEPQRTGKWLEWMEVSHYGAPPTYVYSCSGCRLKSFGMHNFCPNCGAKMKEGGADEAD